MLLQADQASDGFSRLAMEILDAQRQGTLDASQFTKDEATQLIELIDTRVRVSMPSYVFDEGFNSLQILQHEDIPGRLKSTAFGF
jgi:hypothetical protein